ncbi:hypothetical protein ACFQMA_10375 [Halosimplex aquaticum]|uniref:DUF7344 domain-containing protein n=1 Tax=Halosimplex aquaticum TaxID=3026162 RepID=A0ABD5XYW5_9EURY|nr:hypothetical protein [Halosimplex aquaticum]
MSTLEETPTRRFGNETLDALTNDARRHVLAALAGASGSMTERELAAELAAVDRDGDAESVGEEAVESAHVNLHHSHLPRLADAGLVSWDRSEGAVSPTNHPLLDDGRFEQLLRAGADEWEGVRACVANEHRRAVLDVVAARTGPVSRAAIARELAARDVSMSSSPDAVHSVEIQLHHVHLPKLDDAGLVDYDADAETVASSETDTSAVSDLLVGA